MRAQRNEGVMLSGAFRVSREKQQCIMGVSLRLRVTCPGVFWYKMTIDLS